MTLRLDDFPFIRLSAAPLALRPALAAVSSPMPFHTSSPTAALLALASIAVLAGCASIDYVAPTGPKATLTVTSTHPAINTPVRIHDPVTCDNDKARRVGWLNSQVAGAPATGNALTFDVPAGGTVGVSVLPAHSAVAVTANDKGLLHLQTFMTACDRVVDFTPVAGARYRLQAELLSGGQCSYQLTRTDGPAPVTEPSAHVRDTCTVKLN